MNYELAKKLKDAGFRQIYKGDVFLGEIRVPFDTVKHGVLDNGMQFPYMTHLTSIPTLSELIEVCGDNFCCVRLVRKGLWIAEMKKGNPAAEGSTPESAVANLWLALNKK